MAPPVVNPSVDATAPPGRGQRAWRLDAWLLGFFALVLRLPALFASAHLTFDDGVYGASALAMRDGGRPFIDVFSSQGPLHLPLIYVSDLLGFRALDAPRLASVAAGVAATVVTYAIGRRLTHRAGAVTAAALVATSGSLLFVTGPISGDGPALALGALALLLALRYQERPSTARAVVVGVAMGASVCVKLLVLPAALPVGLVLLRARRWRDLAAAIGASVLVFAVTALPWGIAMVWEQSVAYHQGTARMHGYGDNVVTVLRTLVERDPFVVAALALAVVAIAWRSSRRDGEAVPAAQVARPLPTRVVTALLLVWAGAQLLLLVLEPALWRPHVAQLIIPLALLAALRPAPWQVLVVVTLALAPWWIANVDTIVWPSAYDGREAAVVHRLERLPEGAQVITDEPGFAWRAQRRPPDDLVDTSIKRIEKGDLTAASVAHAARGTRVCAVLIWSRVRFASLEGLTERLEDAGYHVAARYGGPRVLYERGRCPG